MKIVINNCFGGFSLSPKAVKRLAELQGKKCFFYDGGLSEPYKLINLQDISDRSMFWSAFTIDDADYLNRFHEYQNKKWHSMTDEEKNLWNSEYEKIRLTSCPENRTDKLLIQVIEELGEEANGNCASLKIVEIPDGIDYSIEEYDGNEHIAESHRTWS